MAHLGLRNWHCDTPDSRIYAEISIPSSPPSLVTHHDDHLEARYGDYAVEKSPRNKSLIQGTHVDEYAVKEWAAGHSDSLYNDKSVDNNLVADNKVLHAASRELNGTHERQEERSSDRNAVPDHMLSSVMEVSTVTTTWVYPTLVASIAHQRAKELWQGHAASSPGPLTEFSKFSQLPTELRVQIWEYAVPGPRTVAVVSVDGKWSSEYFAEARVEGGTAYQPRALTQVPAMLHASTESRAVALESLKLYFHVHFNGSPVYFNPKIDTLMFYDNEALKSWICFERDLDSDSLVELRRKTRCWQRSCSTYTSASGRLPYLRSRFSFEISGD